MVLAAAARLLESRARSIHEVSRRLLDAGYRTELVEGVIGRLVELGILDDEAFGRAWVESRDRAHPRGARALRDELRRKGIDGRVIDAILADRATDTSRGVGDGRSDVDLDAAERLLARHAAALRRVADPRKRRQRAYGLLARHGFDPDTAASVASAFVSGSSTGDDAGP